MDLSWPRPYVQASASAWSNGLPALDIDGPWTRGYQGRSGTHRAYQAMATWQRPEGQWSLRVHRQWGLAQTWLDRRPVMRSRAASITSPHRL